jgi:hypothetical protein
MFLGLNRGKAMRVGDSDRACQENEKERERRREWGRGAILVVCRKIENKLYMATSN